MYHVPTRFSLLYGLVAASLPFLGQPVPAAEAAPEYFQGKTIHYHVGSKPGGGYDRYARLIAPFLEKHLPGSRVVVVNRPAGAGVAALNELSAAAPDGLTLMTMNTGLLLSQIGGREGIRFDLSKLDWLGKAGSESRIVVVQPRSGIADFRQLRDSEAEETFAVSGYGSSAYIQVQMLRNVFDLRIRVLPGFGGSEAEAALIKGEVDAILTSESNVPELMDAGQGVPILRFGEPQLPVLAAVPPASDHAESPDQRLVARRITTMNELGRLTATAPGTPAPILAALRDAYHKALNDPMLLEQAQARNMPIAFLDGVAVQNLVEEFLQQGDNFRQLVEKALDAD